VSADASEALRRAIEACHEAWRERFDRSPRACELVHAFEICLASTPEQYVIDPDDCAAVLFPARPAPEPEERARIRPGDLEVTFITEPYEVDRARVWRRAVGEQHGCVLELHLEVDKPPRDKTLLVDYQDFAGMTISELRSAFKGRIGPRYLQLRKLEIDRVRMRPLIALDDPWELELWE